MSKQADLQDPSKVKGLVLLQNELINLLIRLRQLLQDFSCRLCLLLLASQNLLLLLYLQCTKTTGLHSLIYCRRMIRASSSWLS